MIRTALKEAKINKILIVFASLGLSVLLGIIFALSNFNLQMTGSYSERYNEEKYISLESNKIDLLSYSLEGFFVYGRAKGVTFAFDFSF